MSKEAYEAIIKIGLEANVQNLSPLTEGLKVLVGNKAFQSKLGDSVWLKKLKFSLFAEIGDASLKEIFSEIKKESTQCTKEKQVIDLVEAKKFKNLLNMKKEEIQGLADYQYSVLFSILGSSGKREFSFQELSESLGCDFEEYEDQISELAIARKAVLSIDYKISNVRLDLPHINNFETGNQVSKNQIDSIVQRLKALKEKIVNTV
eukprot:CAMPEP_0170536088 /NCGR_PEP_ID=MMETSP0209-20121228/101955_1 /TAXON_ID=665100 ORGANISM="Litonotus pictus, Strain P1" /NCGR_SAMPLE_ID=MMETSP0209 /ASSEMBLY_ACC=CAM_ASM_000301 /LENGTH=205 /DNA_ID=CAMNT_0010837415 /DNA_START=698 /DNA_END=1315 /DNA_ORIENTATION=-